MTLEQLRIFVAVAERQHVTRAAEALNLTQSAVSSAIGNLEGRHAAKLFHRVGRRIELSEAGRLFLGEAKAVLQRAASAERVLAELSGLKRGTLSVQASQTIASYWLPRHLVAFRRLYGTIEVDLSVGNTAQVAAATLAGTAEIGFVEGAVEDPMLDSMVVAHDELVLVVAPDHPWAGRADIAPEALAESAWVLREAGSGTRSVFEAALASSGVALGDLPLALTLPSNESVRAAVEAGAGATVISASVAASGLRTGLLAQVGFDLPARPFHVLSHRSRYRSRAATALLDLIATETKGQP